MPKEKKGILSVILNGDNPVKVSKKQAGKLRGFFKKIVGGLTGVEDLALSNTSIEYPDLSSLTSLEGLKLPKHYPPVVSSLTSLEGLKLPEHIEYPPDLSSLTSLEGLEKLSKEEDIQNGEPTKGRHI